MTLRSSGRENPKPDEIPLTNLEHGGYRDYDDHDEMWDLDLRPKIMGHPFDGRSADPLLDDEEDGRGRFGAPYEGPREVDEMARQRHEMRSKSPASTTTVRLVSPSPSPPSPFPSLRIARKNRTQARSVG
jgi:hypothetical protein